MDLRGTAATDPNYPVRLREPGSEEPTPIAWTALQRAIRLGRVSPDCLVDFSKGGGEWRRLGDTHLWARLAAESAVDEGPFLVRLFPRSRRGEPCPSCGHDLPDTIPQCRWCGTYVDRGWHWGAFGAPAMWALMHGEAGWGFLMALLGLWAWCAPVGLLLGLGAGGGLEGLWIGLIVLTPIGLPFLAAWGIAAAVLARKADRMAYASREWPSDEEYLRHQRAWATFGRWAFAYRLVALLAPPAFCATVVSWGC